jgi:hypothetical protein
LNYRELYGEPTNNHAGTLVVEQAECLRVVYELWRATGSPCTVEALYQNMLADFSRTIDGIGVFIPDGDSASDVLWILHTVHSNPGTPGVSRYWMKTFCFEGDVSGVDISTVAFDENQLTIDVDVIVSGSIEWKLQLFVDEPTKERIGPFEASNTNVRTAKARCMAYIPYEVMDIMLGVDVMARQAY